MKAGDFNSSIIEGYIKLLNSLSPGTKLDLISKLTDSIKSDISDKKTPLKKLLAPGNRIKALNRLLLK